MLPVKFYSFPVHEFRDRAHQDEGVGAVQEPPQQPLHTLKLRIPGQNLHQGSAEGEAARLLGTNHCLQQPVEVSRPLPLY